ncbi:MAG: substrate-binding domain-containing protein [Erysipelotrichaceae bacterium]|nr:substrate-binding domain-containing protein [Erysipelotrichaceae bacterium]
MVVCTLATTFFYNNRDEVRYAAHGFKYMNGYSSTDFKDYMVYSDPSKLVTLDHEPSLIIENESGMPVMDGAEACYPVYSAVAKAIYKDIDKIEEQYKNDKYNGKIVTFTNTVNGYYRLVDGKIDMLFGARPSKEQTEYAKSYDKTLRQTLIGKEAFVFFVENDNPVSDISSEQLRAIYHGDITNWKEVGGKNQAIVAFQRPEGSGSQTMMEYFMGDVTLKEPKSYEQYNAMDGIVKVVANYANEDGALGYSFRYFIEGLMQEKNIKILSIDGVYPTTENIRNGSYPLVTGLYCVTLENEPNPNVEKVLDFLLSEDGQYIIEQTGYVGIGE